MVAKPVMPPVWAKALHAIASAINASAARAKTPGRAANLGGSVVTIWIKSLRDDRRRGEY
jgi:hypothetical protein